ncbi:MAG: hypothetical protein K9N48_00315, partial [Verrucomicrobia bacterium]|nr:hypothetical protein [Verrucomicrobiota bacterium]
LTPSQDGIVLSWQSASGMVYRVEGKVNLEDQGWNIVVSNLPATPPTNSFTVPFSNTNNFFRIGQSLAEPQEPPPSTNLVTSPNLTPSQDGIVLSWQSASGMVYRVEGKVNLEDQGWNIVVSNLPAAPPTNSFTVPFSNTNNFFRIGQSLAEPQEPPPSTNLVTYPNLTPSQDGIVLSWQSTSGIVYRVEGKVNLEDQGWNIVASNLPATPPTNYFTVQFSNTNNFFRIGQQTAQSKLTINPTLNPDDTISLSWPATPGEGYEVLISSNLIDWTTLTTITATGTTGIFKDVQATNAHVRFYRIKVSP